jgi:hypothetical protein
MGKIIRRRHTSSAGNALFLILIAIFLLGGVTALLVRTGGTSEETGSTEKDRIAASEIIRYSTGIAQAVSTLQLRGCSETQIEGGDPSSAISDPLKPSDGSCSIFRPAGTGIAFRRDLDKYRIPAPWPYPGNFAQFNLMDQAIQGLGTDPLAGERYDSLFIIAGLQKNICIEINNILGNTNPAGYPPRDSTNTGIEGGLWAVSDHSTAWILLIDTTGQELKGKKAGCWVNDKPAGGSGTWGTDYFYFYTALIIR